MSIFKGEYTEFFHFCMPVLSRQCNTRISEDNKLNHHIGYHIGLLPLHTDNRMQRRCILAFEPRHHKVHRCHYSGASTTPTMCLLRDKEWWLERSSSSLLLLWEQLGLLKETYTF